MSRHRFIRNLNVESVLDDDAISDGGDGDLTDEQHAQMVSGLEHIRTVLGSEDDSGLDNKTIQDTLWGFYFDVEKSIGWLIEEQHRRRAARERKDGAGKPLPPLPPHEHEPASPMSPVYHNHSPPSPDEDEYYEPTEMSGYPETYRPALSTITEMTERSEYSRNWSPARQNAIPDYADSLSSVTEYTGQYDSARLPPSPTQSALQRLSVYEAAPSPGTRTSSATPTPRASNQLLPTVPVIPPEFMNRQNDYLRSISPSSTESSVPAEDNVEDKPKKSKLSSLASSRTSTKSISTISTKSSRSFFVDSDSVLTYPALRPSPGSRMSLSSQVTSSSDGLTSTSSHIRRAVQTAMDMEYADLAPKQSEVVSEPSDVSTPRQHSVNLEAPSPSTSRSPPRTDSQGRTPSKLVLLAQSKAQQNAIPWVPKPKVLRSPLPETQEHNIRTKYVTPIANGPTATTAITTSYQSLGNLMPHSWSALPASTPLPSEPPTSGPISPKQSTTASKKLPTSPKHSATTSSKQSKLAMKIKHSQQQKVIPEAGFIEELGDPSIQPLFLPPSPQPYVLPSAFASVLIEEVNVKMRKSGESGRSRESRDRDGESHKSKRRSHKDQPLPPAASPSSNGSGFAFDIPSPDDIIFNARKGTSVGHHSDARTKSAQSASSNSTNISSPPKRVSSRA